MGADFIMSPASYISKFENALIKDIFLKFAHLLIREMLCNLYWFREKVEEKKRIRPGKTRSYVTLRKTRKNI